MITFEFFKVDDSHCFEKEDFHSDQPVLTRLISMGPLIPLFRVDVTYMGETLSVQCSSKYGCIVAGGITWWRGPGVT